MITTQISLYAFYGARGILVILVLLSVFSIAFFIERLLFYGKNMLEDEKSVFTGIEAAGSMKEARNILVRADSAETRLLLEGINRSDSKDSFQKKVRAYFTLEKGRWERFTTFLGSVGSNAPFIGLLGTVLGILKSFADLGLSARGGPQVVMAGISEALIVTAVGLAVAIPAVIFFNICKNKVKKGAARVEALTELVMSKDVLFANVQRGNSFQPPVTPGKLGRVSRHS